MPQNLLKARAYQRKRKRDLLAKGLCVHCGKVPFLKGKTRCLACIEVGRASARKGQRRRRAAAAALNLCLTCCDRIRMPGQSQCGVCAEARDTLRERTAARRYTLRGLLEHLREVTGVGVTEKTVELLRHQKPRLPSGLVDGRRMYPKGLVAVWLRTQTPEAWPALRTAKEDCFDLKGLGAFLREATGLVVKRKAVTALLQQPDPIPSERIWTQRLYPKAKVSAWLATQDPHTWASIALVPLQPLEKAG